MRDAAGLPSPELGLCCCPKSRDSARVRSCSSGQLSCHVLASRNSQAGAEGSHLEATSSALLPLRPSFGASPPLEGLSWTCRVGFFTHTLTSCNNQDTPSISARSGRVLTQSATDGAVRKHSH